jgi:mono/diheme cytochrome c family protein
MTRRLILGGTVAIAALLTVSSVTVPAWAQGPWNCPAAENAKKNPVAKSDKAAKEGKEKTVEKACNACHGDSGKGDGPGAAALTPKPADWTSAKVQQQSDGCLFWKISTGRGAMPPWSAMISEEDRWEIVHYIRTLKK